MRTVVLPAGPAHHGARSARMTVDETDHIGRIIARGHWYEHDLLEDARQRVTSPSVRSRGTAVDVGAHVGNHSLWFALAMGLHVVALEPNPASYSQLCMNIANNRVNARLIAAAAGRAEGWATVHPPMIPGNSGTATVTVDGGPIPVFALDELGLTDVQLIKVDVEGAALDVLAGAQQLIAEQSPILYVEAEGPDEIAAVLPAGYECFGRFAKTPTWGFTRW